MERIFRKPLLDENALCIYRQPGSVKGVLVHAGQWRGGSAGFAPAGGGPLVSHRFMQTRPPMGPLVGVSDKYLAEVSQESPLLIAAEFVSQLADDELITGQPTRLLRQIPALMGDATVELAVASSGGRWRCSVVVNGMEVASAVGDTHVGVLKKLTQQLQESDSIAGHSKNRKNHQDLVVSRVN